MKIYIHNSKLLFSLSLWELTTFLDTDIMGVTLWEVDIMTHDIFGVDILEDNI